jgi:hypothetical protein
VVDGLAASRRVEVPDKAVGDQAHAGEHHAPLAGAPEVVQPPVPVLRPAQLDAVEARGLGELPLLQDAVARQEVFLTGKLQVSSSRL